MRETRCGRCRFRPARRAASAKYSRELAVWAPDGRLLFAKEMTSYLADHDGANPRKLLTAPGSHPPPPTFHRMEAGSDSPFRIESTILRVCGKSVPTAAGMHPLLSGWNNPPAECCGTWTPDGRYYLFQSAREGDDNIWIVPDHIRLVAQSLPRSGSTDDWTVTVWRPHSPAKMARSCL